MEKSTKPKNHHTWSIILVLRIKIIIISNNALTGLILIGMPNLAIQVLSSWPSLLLPNQIHLLTKVCPVGLLGVLSPDTQVNVRYVLYRMYEIWGTLNCRLLYRYFFVLPQSYIPLPRWVTVDMTESVPGLCLPLIHKCGLSVLQLRLVVPLPLAYNLHVAWFAENDNNSMQEVWYWR